MELVGGRSVINGAYPISFFWDRFFIGLLGHIDLVVIKFFFPLSLKMFSTYLDGGR